MVWGYAQLTLHFELYCIKAQSFPHVNVTLLYRDTLT